MRSAVPELSDARSSGFAALNLARAAHGTSRSTPTSQTLNAPGLPRKNPYNSKQKAGPCRSQIKASSPADSLPGSENCRFGIVRISCRWVHSLWSRSLCFRISARGTLFLSLVSIQAWGLDMDLPHTFLVLNSLQLAQAFAMPNWDPRTYP